MADALILKLGGFDGLTILTTGSIAQYAGAGTMRGRSGSGSAFDAVLDGRSSASAIVCAVTATLLIARRQNTLVRQV